MGAKYPQACMPCPGSTNAYLQSCDRKTRVRMRVSKAHHSEFRILVRNGTPGWTSQSQAGTNKSWPRAIHLGQADRFDRSHLDDQDRVWYYSRMTSEPVAQSAAR